MRSGPQVGRMAHHPCRLGGAQRPAAKDKKKVAHKWGDWLHHHIRPPLCLGSTSPLLYEGSATLQSRRLKKKWSTRGPIAWITPPVRGVLNASVVDVVIVGNHGQGISRGHERSGSVIVYINQRNMTLQDD